MLWLHRTGTNKFGNKSLRFETEPAPTIMKGGICGGNGSQYWIEDDGFPGSVSITNKPPYRIPSMAEIEAMPWNGLKVASTFSGCGGSCLGYRMAGYRVVWANEFIPAAQAAYRLNHPNSHLDTRDIREIQAADVIEATGLEVGELDLLDGSPPCQAFSTAGKRHKGWGNEAHYGAGMKQCNETLFGDYLRLLRGLMPRAFVAENVYGLLVGKAKGFFIQTLQAMKEAGYRVRARLLDAQWLGVPQRRARVIFIGVRNDLDREPVHPKPLPYRYSVKDVLPYLSDMNKPMPTVQASAGALTSSSWHHGTCMIENTSLFGPGGFKGIDKPAPTMMAQRESSIAFPQPGTKRKITIAELKRLCSFPDDFRLEDSYTKNWERLGNSVPPVMMMYIAEAIRDEVLLSPVAGR